MFPSIKSLCQSTKIVLIKNSSVSQLCRSFMYVPGDKQKMISKIVSLPASKSPDIVVFDCEDGVGYNNKSLARQNILQSTESGLLDQSLKSTICIRMNAVASSSLSIDDVRLICEVLKASNYRYPHMINLPKVEDYKDISWLDEQIKSTIDVGRLAQPMMLSVMIESCRAVVNLKELLCNLIAKEWSCFRLSNIVFGSDDYCASLGVARSRSNEEVLYARQHLSNVAAAYNISAIDMVETDLNDMDYFAKNCAFGSNIGFLGKQVIHPKQLDVVHAAFTPASDKIIWATDLLNEFEKNKEAGQGVFVFRSNMIDMPTVIQAKNIVKMAALIKDKL